MSKEKKTESQEAEVQEGSRIYELGFHFVPTISEDDAAVQFSHLKSVLEKKNATFISEEAPALISLAYELTKTIKAVKQHYKSAYFGWVKFEIEPEAIVDVEKEIKAFDPILRYLLISTVKESTLAPVIPKEIKEVKKAPKGEGEAPVVTPVVDETQIDKSIDQLVQE